MNKQLHKTTYLSFLLVLLFSSHPLAVANTNERFNYSQTVALILKAEKGGGYIFQRPERDDPLTAFVPAFAIIYKYISQMQPAHSGLALDMESLQPQYSFLLINHQSTKLLYLGDYWLGDEDSFAVMESVDYQNLKRIFDSRIQVSTPGSENGSKVYIKTIHDLWLEDHEEFYRRYYFPERDALVSANTPASSINASSYTYSSSSLNKNLHSSAINRSISHQHTSSVTQSSMAASIGNLKDNQPVYDSKSRDNNLVLKIILVGILIFVAGYWWWHKRQ